MSESSHKYEADKLAGKTVGKYHFETLLGEGGMAYVYRGRHVDLDNVVAIKVLFPEYLRRDVVRTRFKREAKLQCKLLHPNIVRVIDLLEEGRLLGMVMDLVDGSDLSGYLKQQSKPMGLYTVRRFFLPILDAMGYAHSQGVIHRDLKPHNIMLHGRAGSEIPKVMDFGIARTVEDDGFKTKTGVVIGTPYYISPEQAMASKDIDHRTDIYALGVTLYQMLTGHLPFFGESAVEVISGHCFRPVPSVRELRRDLDAGIDAVLQQAMAKIPNERFQDCDEFASALEKVLPRRAGDTRDIAALPSLDEVHQSREDLDAADGLPPDEPSHHPSTPSQDALSLHTRIEGWKQSQQDGPHPPLPSASLPAVPHSHSGLRSADSHSESMGLPSGVRQPSKITSPKTTPWLLAAIVLLVGGIGAVWAAGGFKLLTGPTLPRDRQAGASTAPSVRQRRQPPAQPQPTRPAARADAQPAVAVAPPPQKAVIRQRSIATKRAVARVAGRRSAARRAMPRRTTPRRAPARKRVARASGTPSKRLLARCQRCIQGWFQKAASSDLMGHNPHALGGSACNYRDFLRVAKHCRSSCGRRYHAFCMSYIEHKTGQCRKLLLSTSLLLKLQSTYKDSHKLTARRCLRDWR